jgi:predicted amidophosphoribosyltransferase
VDLCPECGAQLEPDDIFCANCGANFGFVCPMCAAEVQPGDSECANCGSPLDASMFAIDVPPTLVQMAAATVVGAGKVSQKASASQTAAGETPEHIACPRCRSEVYVLDGVCSSCGLMICPRCGTAVDEESDIETCANCGLALVFFCPGCGFELLSSATACPECNRLFIRTCPGCGQPVFGPAVSCDNCGRQLHLEGRAVAQLVDVAGVLPMVICPECSTRYPRGAGICPECQTRVCRQCALVLDLDELVCPRCGAEGAPVPTFACPVCGADVSMGAGECPACEAALCPECGGALDEDAVECFRCGAKIGLYCPSCGEEVAAEDESCAHCGMVFEV